MSFSFIDMSEIVHRSPSTSVQEIHRPRRRSVRLSARKTLNKDSSIVAPAFVKSYVRIHRNFSSPNDIGQSARGCLSSSTYVQEMDQSGTRAMMQKIVSFGATERGKYSCLEGRNSGSSQGTYSIEAKKNVITFEITSSSDLRQNVVIDSRFTCIEFRGHPKFPDFQGTIKVEFLTLSVFGKEKVFFEIVPDTVIGKYNQEIAEKGECGGKNNYIENKFTSGKKLEGNQYDEGVNVEERKTHREVVTPILHIDRQNGSPFLRPVKVTLPLMNYETLQNDIKQSKLKIGDGVRLTEDGNSIEFQQTKFSPAFGVRRRNLLNAFCFTGDHSLDFETKGVYFIAKQISAETVEIDLRRFRSWQEHRKYRMDETAVYFAAANPAAVEPLDHYSEVHVFISDVNSEVGGMLRGRGTTMRFPNPQFSVDTRNRRYYEIPTELIDPTARNIAFNLRITFQSPKLSNYNLIRNEILNFCTPNEYERLQSITQPSYKMLLRVVKNIHSIPELIELLVDYFECVEESDVEHLSDFILEDIKETLDGLYLSDIQLNEFGRSIRRRFSNAQFSHQGVLEAWFSGYRDHSRLGNAKQDVLGHIRNLHLTRRQVSYLNSLGRGYLLEQSCSILTHALLYVTVDRLKEGLRTAVQRGVIVDVDDDLRDFIYDRTQNPIE